VQARLRQLGGSLRQRRDGDSPSGHGAAGRIFGLMAGSADDAQADATEEGRRRGEHRAQRVAARVQLVLMEEYLIERELNQEGESETDQERERGCAASVRNDECDDLYEDDDCAGLAGLDEQRRWTFRR
jgi:hypothetical protein